MKLNNIYVATESASIDLTGGTAVAAFPARKGDDRSFFLLASGKIVFVKGSRINGIGVKRFVQEAGFVLAEKTDVRALKLADYLDVREGTNWVSDVSRLRAAELQKLWAGQACSFVPFDADQAIRTVTVEAPRGSMITRFDMETGFTSGCVQTVYQPGSPFCSELAFCAGWLVGPGEDPSVYPRNTEYGGVVERAAFVIDNVGIAVLEDKQHLSMVGDAAPDDAPFVRGELNLRLANSDDVVQVGIAGGDELVVNYIREGAVVYSRTGITQPRLGEVVGDIAAVIIRVRELDEATALKSRKKAA
jgi:hypothetical protein